MNDVDNPACAVRHAQARCDQAIAGRRGSASFAEVVRRLLDRVEVRRVIVAGGDSSGEVSQRIGISALSVVAGMAPGAPLGRAWSHTPRRDGHEIVLKGG